MKGNEKAKHVLVGDDEEHTRLTLSLVLKKAGFKVTTAGDGTEVLDKVLELREGPDSIDLLLIDFQMPGLTGLELVTELGRLKIPWPVLIMSGYSDKEMVAEAMRRGCVGYLEKPFEPDALLKRIEWVLEKTRQLGRKEETMAATDEHGGLCCTCNHAPDCVYPTRATSPVVHCEEFEGFRTPPARTEFPVRLEVGACGAVEDRKYMGLCVNCDLRDDCFNSACEGGVWHCENYQ